MKKLNLFLVIVFYGSFYVETLFCQPILNWNKTYNYNGHQDYPSSIIVDDSGNVYVVGQTEISNNPQTNF